MSHKEKALEYFSEGFHCSQAVIAAYAKECGLTKEQALKLGSCFGGGMRKGEVCGACTGALMVLGLMYGQSHKGNVEERQRSDEINVLMLDRFKEINGSYICNELLGYDILSKEGQKCIREKNLFVEFCPKMVASAVDVVEEIIAAQEKDKF